MTFCDTAPGRLELVRQFVNTRDIDDDLDDIATPEALEAWLAGHDLARGPATAADVARFADVREGLQGPDAGQQRRAAGPGRASPAWTRWRQPCR